MNNNKKQQENKPTLKVIEGGKLDISKEAEEEHYFKKSFFYAEAEIKEINKQVYSLLELKNISKFSGLELISKLFLLIIIYSAFSVYFIAYRLIYLPLVMSFSMLEDKKEEIKNKPIIEHFEKEEKIRDFMSEFMNNLVKSDFTIYYEIVKTDIFDQGLIDMEQYMNFYFKEGLEISCLNKDLTEACNNKIKAITDKRKKKVYNTLFFKGTDFEIMKDIIKERTGLPVKFKLV